MYQIICDGLILHDSRSDVLRVMDPICTIELNKTGSLTFKIQPNHRYFKDIHKMQSEISIYQDGEWIFTGRVLNDEVDIHNEKTVECEGVMGYLLDSIQRSKAYHITEGNKIKTYLEDVLSIHNEQVDDYKKFCVGDVTVQDESPTFYKISSYENTLSTINKDLLETFKGYFICRKVDDKYYLDYLTLNDFPTNTQVIQFGKNILRLTKSVKGEEIATAILPLGATIDGKSTETPEGDTIDKRYDLKNLGYSKDGTIIHEDSSDIIYDEEAVQKYGLITKCITWDAVTTESALLSKAKEQLNYYKLLATSIELNAFDLHLLNVNVQSIRVGQKIRVISKPHGIDGFMIVEKMSLNLNAPDKSTVILSTEERSAKDVNSTLSDKQKDNESHITIIDSGYMPKDKFPQYSDNYFNGKSGTGDLTDLSQYATRSEVQSAFNSLANELEGL